MKKEKSFFLSILGLFLILSLFIIILSTALFINRTRIVIREAFAERNLTGISQVSYMFDVLHAQIIPGLKEASYSNNLVSRLMYSDDLDQYELLRGIEFLDDLLLTYPLIHSLYVYNGQMDYFITTTTGFEPAEDFYDKDVLNLLNNFDNTYIDRYWPRVGTTQNPQNLILNPYKTLTLLMGTTPHNKALIKGALISNIDVRELEKILKADLNNPDNNIFIFNQEGAFICQSGELDLGFETEIYNKIRETDTEGHGSLLIDKNFLVSYQFNYRLGWYIVSMMPLHHLDQSILDVSRKILIIMITLLLISFVFSYLASRRVYKPIHSLVNFFSDDSSTTAGICMKNTSREISFITGRYRDILGEKESLEDSLEELQDDYRIEIFRAILDGHEYRFWKEELGDEDIILLKKPLSLYVLQIDDYYRLVQQEDREIFINSRRALVRMVQSSIYEDQEIFIDKSSRNLVCLLAGMPHQHKERMQDLQRQIQHRTGLTVSVGYTGSSLWKNGRLHEMYDQALSAANGKFALGFNQFIEYSNQDQSTVMFPGDIADKLLQCLRQGSLSGAEAKLELIRKNLTAATYQDLLQHIRIFSYRLLRYLKGMNQPELQKLLQQLRSHPETLETLSNFQVFFLDVLKTLHEETGRSNRKGAAHFQEIEDRLQASCRDSAYCVQSLADDLKISVNYLRQIYKDFSGKSLSDEINRLRVEEAARLLLESDDPVKEIYAKAGFSNYNSFFTSFKKNKGQTPAMFRRNHEKLE